MKATWNGVVVAESDDTVLMDGNHYFPESALKREFVTFARESIAEARKVVWPSRKETLQTTAMVFVFVLVMAIFLWLTDKTLEWVMIDLILGWKK